MYNLDTYFQIYIYIYSLIPHCHIVLKVNRWWNIKVGSFEGQFGDAILTILLIQKYKKRTVLFHDIISTIFF